MGVKRGVRIVNGGKGRRDVDVFDLETGEKLTNVYAVDLHVDGIEGPRVTIVTGDPLVYEGEAELVSPEEHDRETFVEAETDELTVTHHVEVSIDEVEERMAERISQKIFAELGRNPYARYVEHGEPRAPHDE